MILLFDGNIENEIFTTYKIFIFDVLVYYIDTGRRARMSDGAVSISKLGYESLCLINNNWNFVEIDQSSEHGLAHNFMHKGDAT